MKLIRELRMGPPKCGKTVCVVGTYPKPMLVFLFDVDGLDVIPSKWPEKVDPNRVQLDCTFDDIKFIQWEELMVYCKKKPEELPKITAIRFHTDKQALMTENYAPLADKAPYNNFYRAVNLLSKEGCPWQTFVTDSLTSLVDILLQHVSETNPTWNGNPAKWSPAAGSKVLQHIGVMISLKCHCVFICHSQTKGEELMDKDSEKKTKPLGPSFFSDRVGALVGQYFYQTNQSGKPEIWTKPQGTVKAIGCRWPSELPAIVGADFKSIYGKELT